MEGWEIGGNRGAVSERSGVEGGYGDGNIDVANWMRVCRLGLEKGKQQEDFQRRNGRLDETSCPPINRSTTKPPRTARCCPAFQLGCRPVKRFPLRSASHHLVGRYDGDRVNPRCKKGMRVNNKLMPTLPNFASNTRHGNASEPRIGVPVLLWADLENVRQGLYFIS